MKEQKGIDYTKDNVYEAIGRPDLAPNPREMQLAFLGMDLKAIKKYLADLMGAWNGEDDWFLFEGERHHSDEVSNAEEIIEKIDELQELLNDFA